MAKSFKRKFKAIHEIIYASVPSSSQTVDGSYSNGEDAPAGDDATGGAQEGAAAAQAGAAARAAGAAAPAAPAAPAAGTAAPAAGDSGMAAKKATATRGKGEGR